MRALHGGWKGVRRWSRHSPAPCRLCCFWRSRQPQACGRLPPCPVRNAPAYIGCTATHLPQEPHEEERAAGGGGGAAGACALPDRAPLPPLAIGGPPLASGRDPACGPVVLAAWVEQRGRALFGWRSLAPAATPPADLWRSLPTATLCCRTRGCSSLARTTARTTRRPSTKSIPSCRAGATRCWTATPPVGAAGRGVRPGGAARAVMQRACLSSQRSIPLPRVRPRLRSHAHPALPHPPCPPSPPRRGQRVHAAGAVDCGHVGRGAARLVRAGLQLAGAGAAGRQRVSGCGCR